MQNKGLLWSFIILLSLACAYQLSFNYFTTKVENEAEAFANGNPELEDRYLDSVSGKVIYPVFDFTYADCKKQELNLGLDLKGGMSVTLEISTEDIISALASSNSKKETFKKALDLAKEKQKTEQSDFVTLFGQAFKEVNPDVPLASIFYNAENKENLKPTDDDETVLKFLRKEADDAFDRSFEVIRTRVDLFGVAQPNIQKLAASDRILVELPGIKNKERVRQLLQGSAKLEFFETYNNQELFSSIQEADLKLSKILNPEEDSTLVDKEAELLGDDTTTAVNDVSNEADKGEENIDDLIEDIDGNEVVEDPTAPASEQNEAANLAKSNPLFSLLRPNIVQVEGQYRPGEGPVIGIAATKDTAKINKYLNMARIKELFPSRLKFIWDAKPDKQTGTVVNLVAIKMSKRDGKALLEGDVITNAYVDFDPISGTPQITMKMDALGADKWRKVTKEASSQTPKGNIAIVLDGYAYSYPTVQSEIPGGISSISGNFDQEEAGVLANILKAGKLPAPAKIVEEAYVGPSLGQKSINDGFKSFVIALLIVLGYMIFYYNKAGMASDVALVANMFFIVGILASTNIALTLSGIAGIVLTIGMSVDANVLIYERIREELAAGKGLRLAVSDGYKNAYSSIIDSNLTTLLTAVVLWAFGTGPIEGFAKVLFIGILTSLFSAIFITRLIFEYRLNKGKTITFSTKATEGIFKNVNFNFVAKRKIFYVISFLVIAAGMASLFYRGLNYGTDFTGGRTYTVKFASNVQTSSIAEGFKGVFVENGLALTPEVKAFGEGNQIKITTNYMIASDNVNADQLAEEKLNEGLQKSGIEYEVLQSQKVGPTIADDIKSAALSSILFSLLVMFIYIVFRFRKWQFGFGALIAILHDVLVVLSVFSIFYGILPFSLEIDQAFIAAILTVVGYSINDTVVVFDRIREYINKDRKGELKDVINEALNSTLGRTFNTSFSTVIVLLMVFILGGDVIRGFSFALLVGIVVGTYSSLCVATPIVVDLTRSKAEIKK